MCVPRSDRDRVLRVLPGCQAGRQIGFVSTCAIGGMGDHEMGFRARRARQFQRAHTQGDAGGSGNPHD